MPDFFVGDASQQVGMPALWDGNIWVGHSPVIGGFRVEDFFDSPVDAAGDALDVCGGGGYIRIVKVDLAENQSVLDDLISAIGTEITENQAYQLISSLYEDGVFSRKEANYVLAAISRQALDLPTAEMENMIRARILVSILNQLRCEE